MKRFTVTFSNVGRHKKTWSADFDECTHRAFVQSINSQHALMSNGIDFLFRGNPPLDGLIIVGGFREVGEFKITQNRE